MEAPLVPRSSKQAKMLGVGVDLDPALAGGSSARNGQPAGSRPGTGDPYDGWGVPGEQGRGRGGPVEVIPPWGNPASESQSKRKGTLIPSSSSQPLRGTRSASVLRGYGEKDGSVKEKKRGLFGGLLKRRGSKSDLHKDAGYAAEAAASVTDFGLNHSHGHGAPPPVGFDASSLPAKLQARGDATDTGANLATGTQLYPKASKPAKKSRRPTTPISALVGVGGGSSSRGASSHGRGGTDATPTMRQGAVFSSADGAEIALDTNLDSMEGIVSHDAAAAAGRGSLSSGGGSGSVGSAAGAGLSRRAGSDGLPVGAGTAGAANGRRPSLAPSVYGHAESPTRVSPHHHGQASGTNFWGSYGGPHVPTAEERSAAKAASMMGTAAPAPSARPGLGSRQSSQMSITTVTGAASPGGGARAPAPAIPRGSVFGTGASSGAWTAPDSWAVKAEAGASLDHDSSDDDDDDEEEELELETEESETGMSPIIGADGTVLRPFGASEGETMRNGRPGTSGGRSIVRSGRPGTADGEGRKASQKPFMVRIFRVDGTFSTLPVPLGASASEMTAMLARKFQINPKTIYALYLRERGLERRVGPNEKPVLLQKRKFEQAGYTDLDKLEELGREDNSYLCKLVYKAQYAPMASSIEEDFSGESMEFVDLSARGVATIPIFLYKHAHEIRSLNLSKNRPFDLPTDFIQGCTSLRELVLSNMGIKRLPQALRECASLTRLDISNNNIVELEHIALSDLVNLASLKCHNNRLATVPEYFREFRALKYLNLSNNRFDKVPPVVPEIEPLVELDFSFNTVTVVPPEIGKLENLERLNFLANLITTLPLTLGSLVSLRELDCRRNVISDFTPLTTIPALEVLRCEHNQASTLDAAWANLRILTAKHNSLTRFALTGTNTTLTSLNLSYGKLSTLSPEMFNHLGSVETLILDSNTLRILPDTIGSMSNLVTLSVKMNLLTSLPDSLGRLQRLQSLHVSGNDLQSLPSQLWLLPQLTVLNASSNLIKEFPDPPTQTAPPTPAHALNDPVDELDLRKLSAGSKAPPTASGGRIAPPLALSLQKLYLGDNQLGDDIFAPVSLMTELRVLNLSFNDIYEIPTSSLFKCQSLEELYLSGNKLTSLPPDDLERLVNLKTIYLNGNKLQTLPAELGKIKKLYALDVGSNVLKYNIANWPYDWNWNWNLELRYLNLSGNKRLEIKPGHQNDTSNLPRNAKRRNLADFSALTKLHVLGLMDVTLMIPSVPDENEDRRVRTSLSEINDMGYGIADTLGQRFDTLSLVDIVIPRFRSKDDEAIFGLFDAVNKGQNTGAKLVKYLQDTFSAVFTLELSRLKSGEVTSDALRRAFLNINRDFGNLLLPALESRRKGSEISLSDRTLSSAKAGSAGIIVYIRRKRLYVANAGNALAVIAGRGGTARMIAQRHEPFDSGEIARIRTAEGWISTRGYVNDEVDIARSFGFFNVHPAINAAPAVDEIELTETDEFVIIANRGLWEHMSYQAAVDVARTERGDPMAAAAKLRDLAISYGSSSNVMVMVLAVGDLFKAKKGGLYAKHRAAHVEDEGFYGAHKARRGRGEEFAGERYLNLLDREVAPPVGMVALVFTDIRNSTALWESNPGMQTAIRMHNQLLRRQLRAIGGYEVKTEGDAFMVSFPTVTSALLWCLTVQLELLREDWPQEILDSDEGREILDSRGEMLYRGLSVRMGIHWGAPVCEADPITRRMDYFGPIVNRAARISAVADGGQISASQDVVEILQDVVMQQKPGPSSLDSDDGEDEEDPDDYLDPRDKQDIAALKRLGFGITELGERKLKGLESAELISLLWPKALKERIVPPAGGKADAAAGAVAGKKTEVIQDETPQLLDVNTIKGLGKVVQRLEAVCSAIVHGIDGDTAPRLPNSSARPSTAQQQAAAAKRRTLIHPTTLAFPVRADATDDELAALLESYVVRVENCLSTLTLHQLGPFTEVLSALGQAVRLDQRSVLMALTRFAGAMQAQQALQQQQHVRSPGPMVGLTPFSAAPSAGSSPESSSAGTPAPGALPPPVGGGGAFGGGLGVRGAGL
ncbi:cysteinyl-tRNA synthetase [Rhodotorula kratochvilovae]